MTVAYSLARLGALVCKSDKPTGAKYVLEAFADVVKLPDAPLAPRSFSELPKPDGPFDKSETPLAARNLTELMKVVQQAAQACDVGSKILIEGDLKSRLIGEWSKANVWLNQALEAKRAERAEQLGEASFFTSNHGSQLRGKAFEYGDESRLAPASGKLSGHLVIPVSELDLALFHRVLVKLRETAPDLADELFQKTLDGMMAETPPTAAELGLMARYLFAADSTIQLPVDPRFVVLPPGGLPMGNFLHAPLIGNFDLAVSFLNKAAQVVQDYRTTSADPLDCYALAYQMLQKAREYDLEDVGSFQTALLGLETKLGEKAGTIRNDLGPAPKVDPYGAPESDLAVAAQILSRLRAVRFDAARSLLSHLRDGGIRGQLEELILFGEAGQSLSHQEIGSLLEHPIYPETGAKRALLYAAVVPTASHDVALQAILLGLKEVEPLPAPQRVCLLSALATAALNVDSSLSGNILRLMVSADNDAFDQLPGKSNLRCSAAGIHQVVSVGPDRLSSPLSVPGVSAYTIDSFLARAKDIEFPTLESAILELHDETHLANALLTVTESRVGNQVNR